MYKKLDGHNFIELYGKRPRYGFDKTFSLRHAETLDDVGIVVEHPYVVFDFDDEYSFYKMWEIVQDLGIRTRVMRSSRGGHFWFKSPEPLKNQVDVSSPIGLKYDIRSYGRNSMCVVKQSQKWRDWIKFDEDVEEIPFWLQPVPHNVELINMGEGSRNQTLFEYIIILTNAGMSREEIRLTYELINKYIFTKPLSESELNVITRDQAFENVHEAFFEGNRFKHDTFAKYFVNDNNVFLLNDRLYMYDDGFYSDSVLNINRRMIDYISSLRTTQRREVLDYMYLIADEPKEKSPYHIVTLNGMVDVREPNRLLPYSERVFTTNKVQARYNMDAYDEHVDKMLDRIVCNDSDLRLLVEEMIGYCLLPTARFQKAFMLTGGGSNGKSTFLEMLIEFLGNENVSSLGLRELNHNFKLAEITSKLANIGDDISGEYLEDSSIFKKLVTGDDITVDKKNENPYKLRNTAKLIFAANEIPMSRDKTDGMLRRLVIIPFNATFTVNDDDYDPFIMDKLTTQRAKDYLLKLGIEGAVRLYRQNGFTNPEVVQESVWRYTIENNNALGFLEENPDEVLDNLTTDVYDKYVYWCAKNQFNPYKIHRFNKIIREEKGYVNVNTTKDGRSVQIWRKS